MQNIPFHLTVYGEANPGALGVQQATQQLLSKLDEAASRLKGGGLTYGLALTDGAPMEVEHFQSSAHAGERALTNLLSDVVDKARARGFAVVIFSPGELEAAGLSRDRLEAHLTRQGNEALEDLRRTLDEPQALARILGHLARQGWVVKGVDYGEGPEKLDLSTIKKVVTEARACDISFLRLEKDEARAVIQLVWGNSPSELIADHSTSNGFEEALDAALKSVWPDWPDDSRTAPEVL